MGIKAKKDGGFVSEDHEIVAFFGKDLTKGIALSYNDVGIRLVPSVPSGGAYKITPKTGEANHRVLAVGAYVTNSDGIDIQQRDYVDDENYKDEWRIMPLLNIGISTDNYTDMCAYGERQSYRYANKFYNMLMGTSSEPGSQSYPCDAMAETFASYLREGEPIISAFFSAGHDGEASVTEAEHIQKILYIPQAANETIYSPQIHDTYSSSSVLVATHNIQD